MNSPITPAKNAGQDTFEQIHLIRSNEGNKTIDRTAMVASAFHSSPPHLSKIEPTNSYAALLYTPMGMLLGLTGCESKKSQEPSPAPMDAAEVEYKTTWKPDAKVIKTYNQLQQKAIKDEEIDQGCVVIDYTKPGPNGELQGKADKQLDACEVYEFALQNYQKYPEIVEEITGKPIPWSLDDKTAFKETGQWARSSLDWAINTLKETSLKGLDPKSKDYQKKLAVGLYFFLLFPKDPKNFDHYPELIKNHFGEMDVYGISTFKPKLFSKGGMGIRDLGLVGIQEDAPHEASALESLAIGRGWCTENSKLLFAVLERAGLKPFFVHSSWDQMEGRIKTMSEISGAMFDHVSIGLKIDNEYFFLDLALLEINQKHPSFYPLNLRHYLALDMTNQSLTMGDSDKTLDLFKRGLEINPSNFFLLAQLGVFYGLTKNNTESEIAFKTADTLRPNHPYLLLNLGLTYKNLGKFQLAFEAWDKARYLKSPKLLQSEVYNNLGNLFLRNGQLDEAEYCFRQAISFDDSKLINYTASSITLIVKKEPTEAANILKQAELHFQKALEQNPGKLIFLESLFLTMFFQRKYQKALELGERALILGTQNPKVTGALSAIYLELGRVEESKKQAETVLIKNPTNWYALKVLEIINTKKISEKREPNFWLLAK